ncbi:MAG: hypothetical protein A2821_02020 [Candidatus Magasanikbacteria bacterium RIFCSPHIGHO2_01_FULL_41_23]|uniref:DoxX family protein n=1 Tax=Candidatus Magasanikbacteria bacterium RIFCSPLOWO2_01_FULL_40_15 TaxID=1798686 RepID=A0A1F6N2H9_9BACT|nr:MAG: hypothetical protein A2821_02020 [Candidatus Magasanikbacteria bacterium RIFCSPHIGHO2_01_FULL_41_23]OGH67078.1 MAG: hypothetical protein A3C66_00090 [Candidatus Magasanikbacteria bacterium RIFCSPHIGHO2_02_FULL_41_35]OGH75088.1 MAG: hypothetical protein A3F22_04910 [Candidatus Magasanikbacteria bacterium RIFCSPHIGHO2_12_FULL_41_16]OGH78195.1 MAG: hypothetical protein A2983_00070 [Candidatus Magasanikbacteria bacterium RIFCSPLOWO2_01_FULL_40_15]
MNNTKIASWILRIAIAGEFIGHGVFALQGKPQWINWFSHFGITNPELATQLLFLIGLADIITGFIILVKPIRAILLWAALWGFWTALIRPIVGEPIWDFIERWANWGAPLALIFIQGWPKKFKEWFK